MVHFTEESTELRGAADESSLKSANGMVEMRSDAARKLREDLAKSRPFPSGTIIAWKSISASGIAYEYAAIFASGSWYTTIQNDNQHVQRVMSHRKLVDYFSERGDHLADLRVAVDFEAVSL